MRGILDGGVVDGGIEAVDPAHKVLNGVVRQRWKAGAVIFIRDSKLARAVAAAAAMASGNPAMR